MDWRDARFLLSVCCLFALAARPALAADPTWKAGAAKVVITPDKYMWMAGYASRSHAADGKLTDLWAKALALEDARGKRAVIITLDLVGIDRAASQGICQRLEKESGLTREQIAICTSHTHSGPVVAKNLRPAHDQFLDAEQKKLIDEYATTLENKVVAVAKEALGKLALSRVEWAHGRASFAVNRRTNKEAEVPQMRAAGLLNGPIDHDVPVLAVRSPEGKLNAVLFGYACHATVLGLYQWCGDYPGYAQIELEKGNPDCVALFWAGCGGDQNPIPRRTIELAQTYGRKLADAVEAVIASPMQPVVGSLSTQYREIPLAFAELPTKEQLKTDAADKNKFTAARATMLLEKIEAGEALSPTYPYPIGLWRIGNDVQWVILGGEVVIDYALRIKGELGPSRTWVAGYSNDVMAYIPSRRVLTEGGYEGGGSMVYYGLPAHWSPDVEESIVNAVRALNKTP